MPLVAVKKRLPFFFITKHEIEDGLLEKEIQTTDRLLQTESIEQFGELAEILRKQDRFRTNRQRVLILSAIVAAIGTALLYVDLETLKSSGRSVIVPVVWKQTKSDSIFLAFPCLFVWFAVPLCVLFAYYSKAYFAACLAVTIYFGTAFALLFRPSLPDMPIALPYLIIWTVSSGAGIIGEWVTADSSHVHFKWAEDVWFLPNEVILVTLRLILWLWDSQYPRIGPPDGTA